MRTPRTARESAIRTCLPCLLLLASSAKLGLAAADIPSPTTQPKTTYAVHYKPKSHPIGDVHPYFENGTCHFFYLHLEHPAPKKTLFVSSLSRSEDLLNWREVPIRLNNPQAKEAVTYYVVAVFKDRTSGAYHSYYGHEAGRMVATVSDDMTHWRIAEPNLFIPPVPNLYAVRRDPYVFWNPDEHQYGCVMTTQLPRQHGTPSGAFSYATGKNLTHWTNHGLIEAPQHIGVPECPQIFKLNGRWYLLASATTPWGVGGPSYWVSDAPGGPFAKIGHGMLDGKDLCAAQVAFDDKKARWLLMGWIPLKPCDGKSQHWGGHLALPREVFANHDGTLSTRLPDDVSAAICGHCIASRNELIVSPQTAEDICLAPTAADIETSITFTPACREAGLRLEAGQGMPAVIISVPSPNGAFQIRDASGKVWAEYPVEPKQNSPTQLRVIVDGDIIEAFLNNEVSLAARIPWNAPVGRFQLQAQSATATFKNVRVFELKSASLETK